MTASGRDLQAMAWDTADDRSWQNLDTHRSIATNTGVQVAKKAA